MRDIIENKYTYGDVIKVVDSAPNVYRPGEIGEICGYRKIDEVEESLLINIAPIVFLYTVEFNDGFDIEIPENFIEDPR